MSQLFSSGAFLDVVLAFTLVEVALIAILSHRTSRGPAVRALLPSLAAGALLILAMRAVWVGADWSLAAVFLLGSLLAHAADLRSRWR